MTGHGGTERGEASATDSLASLERQLRRSRDALPDGSVRHLDARADVIVGDDGSVVGLRGVTLDATDREEARLHAERLASYARLLADAGAVLAATLDPDQVLRRLAELVVPALADGSTETIDPAGTAPGLPVYSAAPVVGFELRPGDALILYTDGVTDVPGSGALSPEEIADLVARVSAGSVGDVVTAIGRHLEEIRPFELRTDDIAVVVAKVPS